MAAATLRDRETRFDRAWWYTYQEVNAIFADATIAALDDLPGALAWVHDYQLMLVPQLIRKRRPGHPVGFFLHVPWPSPDSSPGCPGERKSWSGC